MQQPQANFPTKHGLPTLRCRRAPIAAEFVRAIAHTLNSPATAPPCADAVRVYHGATWPRHAPRLGGFPPIAPHRPPCIAARHRAPPRLAGFTCSPLSTCPPVHMPPCRCWPFSAPAVLGCFPAKSAQARHTLHWYGSFTRLMVWPSPVCFVR